MAGGLPKRMVYSDPVLLPRMLSKQLTCWVGQVVVQPSLRFISHLSSRLGSYNLSIRSLLVGQDS